MKEVNPRTITGSLSWHKISPLSGYNLICVIPKLHRTKVAKRWRRHWSDGEEINQPLFATRSGNPMGKTEVVALIEHEVRSKGHDLRDEQAYSESIERSVDGDVT